MTSSILQNYELTHNTLTNKLSFNLVKSQYSILSNKYLSINKQERGGH